jgi:hypothetical protein
VGKRIEGVPYHSASLWASYRLGTFGIPQLRVAAGARYISTTRTSPTDYEGKIAAYTLVDALVSYEIGKHWEVAAKAQNLADRKYLYCNTTCRYGDERSVIGSVSYRWQLLNRRVKTGAKRYQLCRLVNTLATGLKHQLIPNHRQHHRQAWAQDFIGNSSGQLAAQVNPR